MGLIKRELHEVYMEALRLHKLSWLRRIEGKRPWYQKDVFDNSHLPQEIYDYDYVSDIHQKLDRFIQPQYRLRDGSGRFSAVLTFREALVILLSDMKLNSNYFNELEVDLGNYKSRTETFRIEIIDET